MKKTYILMTTLFVAILLSACSVIKECNITSSEMLISSKLPTVSEQCSDTVGDQSSLAENLIKNANEMTTDELKWFFTKSDKEIAELYNENANYFEEGANLLQGEICALPRLCLPSISMIVDFKRMENGYPYFLCINKGENDKTPINNVKYGMVCDEVIDVIGQHDINETFWGHTNPVDEYYIMYHNDELSYRLCFNSDYELYEIWIYNENVD